MVNISMASFHKVLPLFLIINLIACTTPSEHFHQIAIKKQFHQLWVTGSRFQHAIYSQAHIKERLTTTLHVYIDGDGSPWLKQHFIASDPTAHSPLILDLMALDDTPSILLGRPCYYGKSNIQPCHPRFWTSHRYSLDVVNSMENALLFWLKKFPNIQNITLIGYSGGGALAILLAPSIKKIIRIITLAANLDIEKWTTLHHYTPLTGSLNPIKAKKIAPNIKQFHIAGEDDNNIPVALIQSFIHQQSTAKLWIIKNQGHCCWTQHWPSLLHRLHTTD